MRVYCIESGWQSGAYNMALDEALLELVREKADETILIVRTYGWQEPTLSLGANQAIRDIRFLLEFYGWKKEPPAVVRRPTGGRAILHGEDISFSFVTNDSTLLRQSLRASYAVFADLIETTLNRLRLEVLSCEDVGDREYLRSPVCFETHTPSDLVGGDGRKLSGSAQLRRQGGLLQHGAAFLKPYGVENDAFSRMLFTVVAEHTGQVPSAFSLETIEALLSPLEESYRKVSGEILASASVTSGSHLEPASF
jgi:lipoate-protein ligase A